jgi:hypothetical protein
MSGDGTEMSGASSHGGVALHSARSYIHSAQATLAPRSFQAIKVDSAAHAQLA